MSARVLRRQARIAVFQAMYALGEDMIGDLSRIFESVKPLMKIEDQNEVDATLCQALVDGVSEYREEALAYLDQVLDVPLDSINRAEQLSMFLAVVEMLACPDTPRKVVINEWIEVTKAFGAPQGYKIVNAVLDKLKIPVSPSDGH